MFERMVVSSAGRRDRRLSRFIAGSSIAYMLLAGSALAVSIYVSDPKLTGSGEHLSWVPFAFVPASGGARPPAGARAASSPRPNLYAQRRLEDIVANTRSQLPPVVQAIPGDLADGPGVGGPGSGNGDPLGIGIGSGPGSADPPPVPPQPKRASQTTEIQHPREHPLLNVSQPVLQGKAIFRKTPEYPALARMVKKEGSVVVEVVISPEGRVESARAVSGDPLLAPTAVAAAREWKFQATYLGNVPVRVAGAITFVFRLGQ